jgi:uncharacterized Zn ribbon protein
MKQIVERWQCKCDRCKHQWITRNEIEPRICPACKSKWWNVSEKDQTQTAQIEKANLPMRKEKTANDDLEIEKDLPISKIETNIESDNYIEMVYDYSLDEVS